LANNLGLNRSFSATITIIIGAMLSRGTIVKVLVAVEFGIHGTTLSIVCNSNNDEV
jgi:hypothetical protein